MHSSRARLIGIGLLATPLCLAQAAQAGPLSVAPSQEWHGNDGNWSSFAIRIGTPEQLVFVLPSTAVPASWAVLPEGCSSSSPPDCISTRGGVFDPNRSTTWLPEGNFTLGFEPNLNRSDWNNGYFGYDQLSLAWLGSGGPTLRHQVVAGIATSQWYLGVLGLNPQSINFTDFTNPKPSLLSSLRAAGNISSLSYGYTAGAHYRQKTQKTPFASLTLGGYDASRFSSNGVSFTFAPKSDRDLVVAIRSVSIATTTGTHSALTSPTLAYVDSTVPHIWLSLDACKAFEAAFGITWDSTTDLYLVNDTLHQALLSSNANVTFQLGNTPTGGPTVEIILPYASFDLSVSWPIVANKTHYFPLRRANDDSQVTLGRAFLQESYLTVDYERHNFSIAQTVFNDGAPEKLVAITPLGNNTGAAGTGVNAAGTGAGAAATGATGSQSLPSAAVAGIVIGVVVVISFGLFLIIRYRRGKAKRLAALSTLQGPDPLESKMPGSEFSDNDGKPVAEIDGQQLPVMADGTPVCEVADGTPVCEVAGATAGHELEGSTWPIYELAGEGPGSRENGTQHRMDGAR